MSIRAVVALASLDRETVHAASDDSLTRPLGLDRPAPGRLARGLAPVRALRPAPILAASLVAAGLGLATFVALVRDPLGGEPHALVAIEVRAAPPPTAPSEPAGPRRSAAEVEVAAGVGIVRPAGAGAPGAIVIQIPDAAPAAGLAPAPDRRLVERGRHGALPRVGEDGARPLDVYARPAPETLPGGAAPAGRIAILLTGLGIGQNATADAARLPPAVTLAFAPYGTDLERGVARAREAGHEVMLQAPMEPFDYPDNDPGPHTLLAAGRPAENLDRLAWVMARFTGYTGLVSFMGGRLTADEAALAPLLREIGARGLGLVDDGASPRSVLAAAGPRARVPTARAEAVLDAVPRADAIDRELARLEEAARRKGFVLASASATPLTVERLARWSRDLETRGILLVPTSRALRGPR